MSLLLEKDISENLILGAKEYLKEFKFANIDIIYTTGAFEVPYIINKKKDSYDGFIALGCIIRGETYHFEIIANECARKIMDISNNNLKPIGFGVLTCENIKQAKIRSDTRKQNKGKEAANACIELL